MDSGGTSPPPFPGLTSSPVDSLHLNGVSFHQIPLSTTTAVDPLLNLSMVQHRMDSLQRFLSESIHHNTIISQDQMHMVSNEIVSAIHQIIVNGAALLTSSSSSSSSQPQQTNLNLNLSLPPQDQPSKDETGSADIAFRTPSSAFYEKSKVLGSREESIVTRLKVKGIDKANNVKTKRPFLDPKLVAAAGDEEQGMKGEISDDDGHFEILEMDAVELLAEHIHRCEICGKGFKRDANLRMHMRAHGNQFKTPEALAKPDKWDDSLRRIRFSCPFLGCNRNKSHKKFRPLKSTLCLKNHFKRSHCPKLFSCNRCNNKSFSVVADLKSHLKHCGESKWRCSCGTSFSRKDKLFGHMALFEGHMPAVAKEEDEKEEEQEQEQEEEQEQEAEEEGEANTVAPNCSDDEFIDGLLEGFEAMESIGYLTDMLGSPSSDLGVGMFGI